MIREEISNTSVPNVHNPNNKRRVKGMYDYSLLFLTIFLVCFGLVMIYSTSSYNAAKYYSDPTLYLRRQGLFVLVGVPLMIIVSKIDYHLYVNELPGLKIRPIWGLYLVCIVLQIYVLIKGEATNGAQRWIEMGSFKFQPSEIAKICIVILAAYLVQKKPRLLDKFSGFMFLFIIVVPLIGLVVGENLSTALVMCAIFVVVCFVVSRKWAYFVIAGVLFLALAAVFIFGVDYRSDRIDIWLDVENHPKGYQIRQGLYAIASGGLFGKGLGNSMQKLGYIPEVHTDMIFAIICEELGIIGAVSILFLFILIIWRLSVIAINAPDLYGGMIAVGVMVHIAVQVIINVAVVTNSIPSTGIPIPFISYGGSSLMMLLMEMGIALSVSNRIRARI